MAWPRMRTAAIWAAGFFAVAEGHQEAVMWFSAVNELWLFLFGMGALLCFLRRRTLAGVALFALALLSKESAVAVLPLFLLVAPAAEWQRGIVRHLVRLTPYLLLAAVAMASIFATRGYSFRFSDGSFSLHAPFWITWPHSYFRVLWIWGLVAGGALLLARGGGLRGRGLVGLGGVGGAAWAVGGGGGDGDGSRPVNVAEVFDGDPEPADVPGERRAGHAVWPGDGLV